MLLFAGNVSENYATARQPMSITSKIMKTYLWNVPEYFISPFDMFGNISQIYVFIH